jgi:glycine/D-amino acid oxidase-like deaminating enzyme/nitrite reductase/ring-hydroxylating ferredoxin subunit
MLSASEEAQVLDPVFGDHRAPWGGAGPVPSHPPLTEDRATDVVVVGGGITGLSVAVELLGRGLGVVVLEAGTVGTGTTGRSTGKVTSQHGALYADLLTQHGRPVAAAYAELAQRAVGRVAELIDAHDIDCGSRRVAAHVHAEDPSEVEQLRTEARAAASLGLPATFVDDAPVPYAVAGAVRFEDQLELDPLRYVRGLATAVVAAGGAVHEHSRVRAIRRRRGRVEARTDAATVRARHVVVATLSPTLDPTLTFARTEAVRAYGIAAETTTPVDRDHTLTVGSPTRSTRRFLDDDGTELLVVVGASQRTGGADEPVEHLEQLLRHAREGWGVERVRYHWSAQDHVSVDELPLVGGSRLHPRLLVATGMRKWGLTLGTAAGRLIADEITGERVPGAFAASRVPAVRTWPKLVGLNLANGSRTLRRRRPGGKLTAVPGPGEGVVVASPTRPVAVATTEDGTTHAVSATCTHLGCTVRWNRLDASWDCPCHGSRFAADGTVLDGPADRPLRSVPLPATSGGASSETSEPSPVDASSDPPPVDGRGSKG